MEKLEIKIQLRQLAKEQLEQWGIGSISETDWLYKKYLITLLKYLQTDGKIFDEAVEELLLELETTKQENGGE